MDYLVFGLVFVVVYFAVIWVVGFLSARRESVQDYLIASRKVGLWGTTASIVAVMGGMVLIAQAALAFDLGLQAIWYWVGIALGMIGLGLAVKKVKLLADRGRFLTFAEYFSRLYGRKVGFLSALVIFIALFAVLVGQFIAAGSLFSPLLGIDYSLAVLILAFGTVVYTVAGGFKAVIRTDMIQFLIMLVVFVFLSFNLDFGVKTVHPVNSGGALGAMFVVMGFFAFISGPEAWQRVFASKDYVTARRSCFLSAGIFLLFGVALTMIGIAAKNSFPDIGPNQALFYGLFHLIPAPLLSLAVLAILAAIMSTVDTELFYLGSSLSKDFLYYSDSRKIVKMTRVFIVFGTILSSVIAILFSDILTIIFGIVSLLMVLSPSFLASLKWRLKRKAVFLSLAVGLGSLLLLIVTGTFSPESSIITLPAAFLSLLVGQLVFRKISL